MKILQWDERRVHVAASEPETPPRTLAEWRAERAEAAAAKFERDVNGLTEH